MHTIANKNIHSNEPYFLDIEELLSVHKNFSSNGIMFLIPKIDMVVIGAGHCKDWL